MESAYVEAITLKDRIIYIVKSMADTFIKRRVTRGAAALSYYLTLSVFPLLICVSAILASLHLRAPDFIELLSDVVPSEALLAMSEFLLNVSGNRTELMLTVGITAMVTTSAAVFRSFTGIMGDIQGKMRFSGIWGGIFSFVFSVIFLAAIYISGFVILSGEWLMEILEINLGFFGILAMWPWLRFVLLLLLLFGIIYGMYIISAPKETKKTQRLPGAVIAAVALVIASVIYSRMISASIRHEILYGSLASIIILMIWLYTCGVILIMGNVFNISLRDMHEKFSL